MKKINIFLLALSTLAFSSCDSYLDKLPDDRAEVNTFEKAKQLLSTAYSDKAPNLLLDLSSDNVTDLGRQYTYQIVQDEAYRWKEIDVTTNDSPRRLWSGFYVAVGTANQVLADLSKVTDRDVAPLRAEALLCRAWALFRLSNIFCMAYDATKADKYLGLPYPKTAGVSVNNRGTLEELYANINADIEEALPKISDDHYDVPKYHFNTRAAYAFAARFNLYYNKLDKAIEYATKALGSNPASMMRSVSTYKKLAGVVDIGNAYINSGENANFMLQTAISHHGYAARYSSWRRYIHARSIALGETFWARMPWGAGSTNNVLYESRLLYGGSGYNYYPKMMEQRQYTNATKTSVYYRIVDAVFTAEETLLVRAEAYARSGKYEESLADMNTWIAAHTADKAGTAVRPVMTTELVNSFFNNLDEVPAKIESESQMGIKKPIHPQGFTIEQGTQTNFIYMILQLRRIETYMQGLRFQDIKRYGIEITHLLDGEDNIYFKAGDLRGALQLPAEVIEAGLEANPREK